jgi:hypothetical protein
MRADALTPGQHYAYIDPDFPQDPLFATVMEPADDGVVRIEIMHPDTGTDELTVATRTLAGRWDDAPTGGAWKSVRDELSAAGVEVNWHSVQVRRRELVLRQRALAARLLRITGIQRDAAPYAGRGGTGRNSQHRNLQLNFDELEELLSRAENPPGAHTSRGPDPAVAS